MEPGEVEVWTDGSGTTSGPWGSCAILRFMQTSGEVHDREVLAWGEEGTNNVAELTAVLEGLRALKRSCRVKIYTDSEYVMNGFAPCDGKPDGRVERWKRNGWKTGENNDVKNKEIWVRLAAQVSRHQVTWQHVNGHAGIVLNEKCDELAGMARRYAKGELTLSELFESELMEAA